MALTPRLRSLFGQISGEHFVVSNDLEMLAASAGALGGEDICVLVAGTGSISMAFRKYEDRYHKLGRAGGWGPILGDDGSGFDVGRQALRYVLENQDLETSAPKNAHEEPQNENADPLVDAVLGFLCHTRGGEEAGDILSAILVPESSDTRDPKQRIAEVAKIVLQEQDCSRTAAAIIARSTASLTDLVQRVVRRSAIKTSKAVLVLTGGMMQSPRFQENVVESIVARGLSFGRIEVVAQPGLSGAQHLLKSLD